MKALRKAARPAGFPPNAEDCQDEKLPDLNAPERLTGYTVRIAPVIARQ